MSVEFLDSFQNVVAADLANKWNLANFGAIGTSSPSPFIGSQYLVMGSGLPEQRVLPANQGTLIIHTLWRSGNIANGSDFMGFMDGATYQMDLVCLSGGTVRVTRNGTTLGTTTAVLLPNAWTEIIFKVVFATGSGGSFDLYFDNVLVLTGSGINTSGSGNAYANRVHIGYGGWTGVGWGGNQQYNYIYVYNGAGSDHNTVESGKKVIAAVASGNGAVQNFTRSTGASNVANVDDATPNSDTDYNYSPTPGDIDLYTMGTISGASSVSAVQVTNIVRKDDVGVRTISGVTRISGTNYVGAGTAYTVGASYAAAMEIFPENPATSSAWTQSTVNSSEFGIKVIS